MAGTQAHKKMCDSGPPQQMLRCSDDDDPDVKNIRSFAQLCSGVVPLRVQMKTLYRTQTFSLPQSPEIEQKPQVPYWKHFFLPALCACEVDNPWPWGVGDDKWTIFLTCWAPIFTNLSDSYPTPHLQRPFWDFPSAQKCIFGRKVLGVEEVCLRSKKNVTCFLTCRSHMGAYFGASPKSLFPHFCAIFRFAPIPPVWFRPASFVCRPHPGDSHKHPQQQQRTAAKGNRTAGCWPEFCVCCCLSNKQPNNSSKSMRSLVLSEKRCHGSLA